MNYDRYSKETEEHYNRKNLSYYLMRKPLDKILIPYVSRIENAQVLEVGIGYGYYTKYYLNNHNIVKGLDMNPQLGKNIGVEIVQGSAGHMKEKVRGKFDYIVSFFMTEYLSRKEIERFITQSTVFLEKGGVMAVTVILRKGLGRLYVRMAGMKGIKKYNYTADEIWSMVHGLKNVKIRITSLNTVMKIPFAILLEIKKK